MLTDGSREYLKRVTVENRILLLLLDHVMEQDSYSVPGVVSQGGMSEKLSIRQNNLSRDLQSLSTRGLLISRSAHITGLQRKRKVYFLSTEGIEQAHQLKKELIGLYVIVKDQDGAVKEWKVGRLSELLSDNLHRKVSIHEIVEGVLEGGSADLAKLLGKKEMGHFTGSPIVKEFFGREEELAIMREAFGSDGPVILSIISIAGQGKTTLVSRFISGDGLNCCWIKVNQWSTPQKLVDDISEKLVEYGYRRKNTAGSLDWMEDPNDVMDSIIDGMAETEMVLVLDDAHIMQRDIISMIRLLRARSVSSKLPIRTILVSRERPRIYGRTEAQVKADIVEIQLEGLDRESVSSFLLSKGIPKPFHDDYYLKTLGHPMTIALLGARPEAGAEEIGNALGRMLEDEVISSLGPEELSVLEVLSIMDLPVDRELLFSLQGVTRETIGGLITKLLVREYDNGTIDVHDLIRDSVRPAISSEKLVDYRRKAYDHFSKRGRDIDLVQTMHFAIELKMTEEVINLISEHGEYLLGRGYPQVVQTVDLMSQKVKDPAILVRLLLLKVDSEKIKGDLETANGLLEKASDLAMTIKGRKGVDSQPFLLSRVLRRSAEIKGLEGSGREVLELYLRSLSLVESSGERSEMALVYSDMGMAYLGMREFDRSISNLKMALDIYMESGNGRGMAETRTDLGIVYYRKLELANSLRELLHASRISREGGFEKIRYFAHYWTGRLYMTVMQPEEAVPYFRSSLLGFSNMGDMMNSYRSLLGLVSSSLKSGEKRKGERSISRLKRDLRGGRWSILPWARIDLSAEVRSLEVHIAVFDPVLKGKRELLENSIGAHMDHLRSKFEEGNMIDAVTSVSWALSKDFKGPNMDYLDLMEKEAKGLRDIRSMVAVMYARATSTEITRDESRAILRKALSLCTKADFEEGKKKVVEYLSLRTKTKE